MRRVSCPPDYATYEQQVGSVTVGYCYRLKREACPAGNPIQCAGGQKTQTEVDIARSGASPLEFVRYYSSTGFYTSVDAERPRDELGSKWRHSWQSAVVVEAGTGAQNTFAYVMRPDGDYRHFRFDGSAWVGRPDKSETLQEQTSGGVRTGWTYTAADDSIARYDANGRWLSLERAGQVTTLTYSDAGTPVAVAPRPGLLIRVTDASNRSLEFRYDAQAFLTHVLDAGGQDYGFRYGPRIAGSAVGMLVHADRPNGTTRDYFYDESAHVTAGAGFRELLTGITDETGQRYATYEYNSMGRAWKEWHGSYNADVMTLSYLGNYDIATSSTGVITPGGQATKRKFVAVAGILRDAGTDRCSTSNCSTITATSTKTYDANGNLDLVTDFNGVVTDHDYNTRGLETKRIDAANASGANASSKRTTETTWNATFRVPDQRTVKNANSVLEARTTWAYNSRGQTTARCEIDPTDSAAMSYACSATSAPPAGAKVRRTVTTYCESSDVTAGTCPLVGQGLSVNGPRPSGDTGMAVGQDDVTAYAYYLTDDPSCATNGACPHRHGDLWKVTNALGQVTEYVSYDKAGRVTRTKDANGTVTDFAYHPRGWLTDRIVRASAAGTPGTGDATMHIDYDAVGSVTKVTQPDGAFLAYTYDDAHRLIKIADNQNNTIDYCPGGPGSTQCLDAAGNRRIEQVKDASGTIKRALGRSYNQLSQLIRQSNAAGLAVEQSQGLSAAGVADGYDGNGNRVLQQDGLGIITKQRYDGLNRLVETIQNYNGTDTPTANTTTGYAYDARDHLRQVTDPDGLNTVYDYDGLNNLTGLHSPDTGNTGYTYDLAGNRTSQTDARGVTSTYTYDALNRLTGIAYPTASLGVTYAYDQPDTVTGCAVSAPVGRLTTMTDASGSTTYCYDRRGNVTKKTQVTSGVTLATSATYTVADRVASITYPSGSTITYTRDLLGRVKTVNLGATTIVGDAAYYPFGPLSTLTYGNGRTLVKAYDQDYAIDSVVSSAADGLKLDFDVDVMGNIVGAKVPGATAPATYAYDPLYRLKTTQPGSFGGAEESWTYNKTGDRLSASRDGATAQVYAYAMGSHRLASIDGVNRSIDDNGNLTESTAGQLPAFTYDDRNRMASVQVSHVPPICTGPLCYGGSDVSADYVYNGRGERVLKVNWLATSIQARRTPTEYVYDEGDHLIGEYDGAGAVLAEYLYLDGVPVAVSKGGVLSYIETDHLGTPRVVADATTNAAKWTWDFFGSAFGADAPDESPNGGASYVMSLRFPGQYADAETGLHYNYFRDYEPATGRYVESDPIGLISGLSTYSYVFSAPLIASDPFGLRARVCCKPIPRIGLFGNPHHCYIEIQSGGDDNPITSYGLVGGKFSSEPYATGNIYIDNPFDSGGSCGDWSDYDGCDECVVTSAHSYANPSDYHYLNGSNSNSFAGNISRQCKLKKPDVGGTTPRWGAPPAPQKPGTSYTPPSRYDGGR